MQSQTSSDVKDLVETNYHFLPWNRGFRDFCAMLYGVARHWVFRCSVLSAVASIAAVVLYLTPLPELEHLSCERPCNDLDWPMICRFKLVVEHHVPFPRLCDDCGNKTICEENCFKSAFQHRILSVNKQFPGPNLQVCENDIILVDVVNAAAGHALGIHWRGQRQVGSPYMDGVPMVTQCPVPPHTTFQYKFRAANHGTHLWHALTGFGESVEGVFGGLIVRRPASTEEIKNMYDVDNHILIFNLWPSFPGVRAEVLVNGVSSEKEEELPRIIVEVGKRYRVRVAHAGGSCPLEVTASGHRLLVVALDGAYISPIDVKSVQISPGERLDFILLANQKPDSYELEVISSCTGSKGLAIIYYNRTVDRNKASYTENQNIQQTSEVLTMYPHSDCESDSNKVCLQQINSKHGMSPKLVGKVDVNLYLPFSTRGRVFGERVGIVGNFSYEAASSPVLTQSNVIKECDTVVSCNDEPCRCPHVINISLGALVELTLAHADEGNDEVLVIHTHGYIPYVIAVSPAEAATGSDGKEHVASLPRNLINPPSKDTFALPPGGAVVLRFLANNPGCWMVREESSALWTRGLAVVLRVGTFTDLPSAPDGFPSCGDWVGPDFFLD